MNETKSFKSTNTGKTYKIRQRLDCDSDWLIYLVTCKKCRGQYVGKSKTPFKIRHSNHKQEIKKDKGGLGHHYGSKGVCTYSVVSVTLIEQVREKNLQFLADRELWWQHQLRVYVQACSNVLCSYIHYYLVIFFMVVKRVICLSQHNSKVDLKMESGPLRN